jgi:hypothetical protein
MVDAGIGDVDVVAVDRTDVRLTTKERRSVWGCGHVKVRGDAARLDLNDGCDGLPTSVPLIYDRCVVRYRLEVPRGSDVRVSTATGDIRAKNLQGSADLGSSTGDVHVNDASGPLRLHTAAGDGRVHAPAPDMVAQTLAGDIELVASHPQTLRAESAAGDVTLVVPKPQNLRGRRPRRRRQPTDPRAPRRRLAAQAAGPQRRRACDRGARLILRLERRSTPRAGCSG